MRDQAGRPTFVYTVDVEDWYHVENLRAAYPPHSWSACESRVVGSVNRLLELCATHDVKGTFFVLGCVAQRHPDLVRAIAGEGHEIACHGYGHELLTAMTPDQIREDISRSKGLLEGISGMPVTGYRAPCFSLTDQALHILAELGFDYDSSLFPFTQHDRYGKIDTRPFERLAPNIMRHRDHGMLEFLLPMRHTARMNLPWAGGGYFRLLPGGVYRSGVRRILDENGTFIFYMHPWEIDAGQPYVRNVKTSSRLRHYVGLKGAYRKLETLLGDFGGKVRLADLAKRVVQDVSAAA